jgi:hypothetical protein
MTSSVAAAAPSGRRRWRPGRVGNRGAVIGMPEAVMMRLVVRPARGPTSG